ncbi:SSI family serine proteinase inhibitor [Streptomyces sp. NPDC007861]|uniref:SSI family serine proteinase inhibitor n=1 Tax=Streptomyces sp. NPDC007861 TaxID=3154893 RepID=UPI0033D9FD3B
MLRRLALTTAATAALVVTAPGTAVSASAAAFEPLPLPLLQSRSQETEDRLTLTTTETGNPKANGTFELTCGPVGGTHPEAEAACGRLAELSESGGDPFEGIPGDSMCTQMYGGRATARITGTWKGHTVDAAFDRTNGCEIDRWEKLEPVLPTART